jgi:large subunit ribosomal protein L6
VSRIGRQPVPLPEGVEVNIKGRHVTVKGPKGQLSRDFHPDMKIALEDSQIVVTRPSDHRFHRSLHGLTRALLANMVEGVSKGFSKRLEIEGIGYRAEMQGQTLVLNIGYSHPVYIPAPPGITITVERGAKALTVEGVDKELVGEMAARIRAVRKPEPYKGKGIRYAGERVRRKAGKAGRVI